MYSTDANSSNIHIYDGRGDGKPLHTISTVHRTSVHLVSYNEVYDTVVSVDQNAMVEYWSPVRQRPVPCLAPSTDFLTARAF